MLLDVAEDFRLRPADAEQTLGAVVAATADWQAVAMSTGLPATELERMAPAFEHQQAIAARELTGTAA